MSGRVHSIYSVGDYRSDQGVIEAALEMARERDKNVDLLCDAVESDDLAAAKLLVREIRGDD